MTRDTIASDVVREPRQHAGAPPAVKVSGLTKRYGATTAVDDLTFEIRAGTIAGFLGPNGAGKTTTFRIVVGLAAPTWGVAEVFGRPYAALRDPVRTVGAMLEISGHHPTRTARNHLRMLARAGGIGDERVDELVALVDLEHAADRAVGGFSSGMRGRAQRSRCVGESPVCWSRGLASG